MFSGEGGQGRRRKKRRGETLKREESWWTHKLVYNFKILQQLTLECISTSPLLLIRFLSLKSLLLICAKCLMLWDHSEYHLLDTAQGINNSNSLLFSFFFFSFFYLFKFFVFSFWFQVEVSLFPFYPILKPRAGRWHVLVMLNTILFLYVEELICNCSSSAL